MRAMRRAAGLAFTMVALACSAAPASAFGAGGTAPGGPLSGSMRPACNGYNMDGTINVAPDGGRPGCIDHSANANRRFAPDGARLR